MIERSRSVTNSFDNALSYLIALYCMALPFEEALAGALGSVLRLLGIVIIFLCIATSPEDVFRGNSFFVPLFLWLSYSFFSVLWSSSVEWWQYYIKMYLLQFAILYCIAAVYKKINLRIVLRGAVLGAVIACLLLILFPNASNLTEDGRRTVIVLGAEFDPNIVGGIIILGFFSLMTLFSSSSNKKGIAHYGSYLCLLMLLLTGLLYTGSRGCLIALVFGLLIKVAIELLSSGKRWAAVLTLTMGFVSVLLAMSVLPEDLLQARFSPENIFGFNEVKTGSHNRYTIWHYSTILFKSNPMFGHGCGQFIDAIARIYRSCASHNLYILLLVEGGIVGFILFMAQITKYLVNLFQLENKHLFIMMVSILVLALTLDTIPYKYFWVMLAICYIYISQNKGKVRTARMGSCNG